MSAKRNQLAPNRPQPQPEAGEIDPFARFAFVEVAAVDADAQGDPEAGDVIGVIVAMLVGVPFEEPAIQPAFLAGVARQVAADGVTINFLLPGTFATDRLMSNMKAVAEKQGISVEQASKARMATVPAKRFGEADEFGAACAFLCSAHAGYITGQNLLIDGGVFPGAF